MKKIIKALLKSRVGHIVLLEVVIELLKRAADPNKTRNVAIVTACETLIPFLESDLKDLRDGLPFEPLV